MTPSPVETDVPGAGGGPAKRWIRAGRGRRRDRAVDASRGRARWGRACQPPGVGGRGGGSGLRGAAGGIERVPQRITDEGDRGQQRDEEPGGEEEEPGP